MKNKKTLYILLPVNILVWGFVVYKIFASMNRDEIGSITYDSVKQISAPVESKDTFSLLANYSDPFLRKAEIIEKPANPKPVQIKKPELPKEPFIWPVIVYGGMIKNQKSSKQLVLVQINAQDNFMKEGDIVGEVQLLNVFKDSIRVIYKKEKKTIKK